MPRQAIDALAAQNVIYFASGSNHKGEILGFAQVGIDVGVAVHELRSGALDAIAEAANVYGARIFVDSGAFSEVTFNPAPCISKPISEQEWIRRLAIYEQIARLIGPRLFAVAPDCVAFQAESLARLERFREPVRRIAALGASILIPCQKGALSLSVFWDRARAILDLPEAQVVAAIPMKKDATSTAELTDFLTTSRPTRVHMLGLGARSARLSDVLAVIPPGTAISLDSALIPALVGRTNGKGNGPRALTATQDRLRDQVPIWDLKRKAITSLFARPTYAIGSTR